MKPIMHAPPSASSLAVTYLCPKGHHDIRFYRSGPVWSTVICAICGDVAAIPPAEYSRHAQLMTSLAEWVV
jgi:hypothetical protein